MPLVHLHVGRRLLARRGVPHVGSELRDLV